MTPPLSEERKTVELPEDVLESYWRQCEDGDERIGLTAIRKVDLAGLIAEVRHLRSERSGYRQGLEDALKMVQDMAIKWRKAAWHVRAVGMEDFAGALKERITRLSIDAGQGSEHISREGNNGG